MRIGYFSEFRTLHEVQRLLAHRFRGAANLSVTEPRVGESACHAVVAEIGTARGREFSFCINGRTATDVSSDLANQISQWMQN